VGFVIKAALVIDSLTPNMISHNFLNIVYYSE
jgi:hypothetical protein